MVDQSDVGKTMDCTSSPDQYPRHPQRFKVLGLLKTADLSITRNDAVRSGACLTLPDVLISIQGNDFYNSRKSANHRDIRRNSQSGALYCEPKSPVIAQPQATKRTNRWNSDASQEMGICRELLRSTGENRSIPLLPNPLSARFRLPPVQDQANLIGLWKSMLLSKPIRPLHQLNGRLPVSVYRALV